MSAPCELLPWDSEFFGFQIARVAGGSMDEDNGRAILGWCADRGVRLLYFLADDDVMSWAVASASGFRLVDIRVELALDHSWSRPPRGAPVPGVTLREATLDDLPALLPIAASVHTDSRFFADRAVPREKARELFAVWLRRSVERAIADVVIVGEVDGRAASYITAKLTAGVGSIGLVGVGEGARGRGIGLALVRHTLTWFAERDARLVTVVTQGRNIMAQRVYQRCGFSTVSAKLWYHRWFQ
jgi:dTDP-4-amino-4,6-dideoxy-D-galactose acyltransferase